MIEFLERNGYETATGGKRSQDALADAVVSLRLVRPAKRIWHRWSRLDCDEYHMTLAEAVPVPEIT
jgi:hypothetical protein